MNVVIALSHDGGMGHGDRELGRKVIGTFIRKSAALRGLQAVLMVNSGVKFAATDSPILPELSQLHEKGIDVLACGTCVDNFDLRDSIRVGTISNMDEIIRELDRADKVITW